jgi:prophage regulatory protein
MKFGAGEGIRTLDPNLGKDKACRRPREHVRFLSDYPLLPDERTAALPSFSDNWFQLPRAGTCRRSDMRQLTETPIRRTIRRQQLREIVPLADSTIYEMEKRGEFPRRFALSPRCVVWDLSEVEAWLASRRSAPIARAQHPDVTQRRSRPVKAPGRAPRAASTVK